MHKLLKNSDVVGIQIKSNHVWGLNHDWLQALC